MNTGKFFRGLALYCLSAGIFFLLFLLAYFIVFARVTANPEQVKQILSDSGVYKTAPAVIYDNIVENNTGSENGDIPLKAPIVRRAVLDSFTPVFLQNTTETAIDGVYGWLQGSSGQPSFTIKLGSVKHNLADSLSNQVAARLKKLPACSAAAKVNSSNFDPYSAVCRPAGTDVNQVRKEVKAAILKAGFLKDADISPGKIKDQSGQSVLADESKLPDAYRAALRIPYILVGVIIFLSAGVVYISRTRAGGFKRLAIILALGGVFAIALPLGIKLLTDEFLHAAATDRVISELAGPVLDKLNAATAKVYYVTGGAYLVLAAGSFLLFRRLTPDPAAKKKAPEK